MDQLWAPWRLAYITSGARPKDRDDCFICRGLAEADDRENLIVERTPHTVVLLNRYPYNNGHLLVAPAKHRGRLDELTDDEHFRLTVAVTRLVAVLEAVLKPDGFNVGLNLGKVAGAGLPGHLHWHVVPRWNGDTNFMTVVSDTRVISQSLEALYDLLAPALATPCP
jgi:ATP adenylyltransferase